jgi:hypothetical protein
MAAMAQLASPFDPIVSSDGAGSVRIDADGPAFVFGPGGVVLHSTPRGWWITLPSRP